MRNQQHKRTSGYAKIDLAMRSLHPPAHEDLLPQYCFYEVGERIRYVLIFMPYCQYVRNNIRQLMFNGCSIQKTVTAVLKKKSLVLDSRHVKSSLLHKIDQDKRYQKSHLKYPAVVRNHQHVLPGFCPRVCLRSRKAGAHLGWRSGPPPPCSGLGRFLF